MTISRRAQDVTPARIRIPSYAVWEVAVFVLNVLAFILVGFQLKSIAARVTPSTGASYAAFAAAVCVAAIMARIGWVTAAAAVSRWRARRRVDAAGRHNSVGLTGRAAAVVGWCGMRGTVTLAAALALPTNFPFRDLILTTAFGVTLGTLVLQGLTLRPLMLRLRLEDDGSVEREVRFARVDTLRAALAAAEVCPGAESAALVRHSYELQLRRAESAVVSNETTGTGAVSAPAVGDGTAENDGSGGEDDDTAVIRAAFEAQRRRLMSLRHDGTIGDAAFQRIEEELDWTELGWAQVVGSEVLEQRER
jgi:CPA1 family monovalent cation:H+ antiporter